MTHALPVSKPETGARFVKDTMAPAQVRDSSRSSLQDEPNDHGLVLWRLIGVAAGGASVPLIIEIVARLFGHRPL